MKLDRVVINKIKEKKLKQRERESVCVLKGIGAYNNELEEVGLFWRQRGTHCLSERERERVLGFVFNRSSSKRKGCGERDRKSECGGVYLLQPQPYYTKKQRIKIKYHSFLFNFSKFHCFAFLCFFLFSFFFHIYIYIYI